MYQRHRQEQGNRAMKRMVCPALRNQQHGQKAVSANHHYHIAGMTQIPNCCEPVFQNAYHKPGNEIHI